MGDLERVNKLNKIAEEIVDHVESTIVKETHLEIDGKGIEERYVKAMVAKSLFDSVMLGRMGKSVADAEGLFDRVIFDVKNKL